MASDEEIRGSTPVYTAKDVLVSLDRKVGELDIKVDGIGTAIQILVSQNLNERLVRLESDGSRAAQEALIIVKQHEKILAQLTGAFTLIRLLLGTNAISAIIAIAALLKTFGVV